MQNGQFWPSIRGSGALLPPKQIDWAYGVDGCVAFAEQIGLDPLVLAGQGDAALPDICNPLTFSATAPRYDLPPPVPDEHGKASRAWLADPDAAVLRRRGILWPRRSRPARHALETRISAPLPRILRPQAGPIEDVLHSMHIAEPGRPAVIAPLAAVSSSWGERSSDRSCRRRASCR
jgi:hypothetical protein